MNEYLLTAFGVIFFSVIISFLIPNGKTNKIILSIIRIICIYILIQPVTKLFLNEDISANTVNFEYVCTVYSKNQSQEMEKILFNEFSVETQCNIVIDYGADGFKVEKTEIKTNCDEVEINKKIYEYLHDLGYINITVNEQNFSVHN